MNGFSFWFAAGIGHILDVDAYDHFLFVALLALSYPYWEWKKLLVLVTAFTVGHSLTLALSVISRLHLPAPVIEFGIAASILIGALFNLFGNQQDSARRSYLLYLVTLLFGLLHGLGFSFLLRAMLGKESDLLLPLLYFNLGVEAGQAIIVALIVVISLFLSNSTKIRFKHFKFITVCIISLVALKICAERFLSLLA